MQLLEIQTTFPKYYLGPDFELVPFTAEFPNLGDARGIKSLISLYQCGDVRGDAEAKILGTLDLQDLK